MLDTGAELSQRERAKNGRRTRIVGAAAALLRTVGSDAMSVAMIADRAEVSAATVYNLFGTKGAILAQVFDQDLADFELQVQKTHARDAIDRIFKAIAIAEQLYRSDPGFYRAMMHIGRGDADSLLALVREPRLAFWKKMVMQARADKALRADINVDAIAVTLTQIAHGALAEWASGRISAERLGSETSYGYALVLLAYATKRAARELRERLERLETLLMRGRAA